MPPARSRLATVLDIPLEMFMKIVDRSWRVVGPLMRGHAAVYRATGGRIGGWLPGVPPMLVLEHTGARTGTVRATPLVYMPDGDRYVVVAAKGGHESHPAWLYNVRAHPDTRIQVGRRELAVRVREVGDQERQELWPRALAYTAHWRRYERRVQSRDVTRTIPILVLEPRRIAAE